MYAVSALIVYKKQIKHNLLLKVKTQSFIKSELTAKTACGIIYIYMVKTTNTKNDRRMVV